MENLSNVLVIWCYMTIWGIFVTFFLLFKASKPLGIMKCTTSRTQLTMQLTSEASHLSSSVSGVMKLLPSILSSKYCLNYLIGYYLWFVTCEDQNWLVFTVLLFYIFFGYTLCLVERYHWINREVTLFFLGKDSILGGC